jgi:hypothetical protein
MPPRLEDVEGLVDEKTGQEARPLRAPFQRGGRDCDAREDDRGVGSQARVPALEDTHVPLSGTGMKLLRRARMPDEPRVFAVEDLDRDLPGLETGPERPSRDPIDLLEDGENPPRRSRRARQEIAWTGSRSQDQRQQLRQKDRGERHAFRDARRSSRLR